MWFILALLSGLLFAVNRLLVRSILTKKIQPIVFGAAHELASGLSLLPLGLFYFSLPQSNETWIALILGVLCIFLCDLLGFLALEKIEASLFQIIGQLRHIVVLFGAAMLFTEDISLSKIISIILIIGGVYVALLGKSKIVINRGTIYAVLSTLFIGLGFLFIKMATKDVAPIFAGAITLTTSGLLMYAILFLQGKKLSQLKAVGNPKQVSLAIIVFTIFEIALFTALSIGEASRVTPVTQSSMVFTLIGGYLFLRERNQMKQKIIGCIIIALGIGMLYFV